MATSSRFPHSTRPRRSFLQSCLAAGAATQPGNLLISATPSQFRAGIARADITPNSAVPARGPIGGSGRSEPVHDPLLVRALALHDGKRGVVVCIADVTMIEDAIVDTARELFQRSTNLPGTSLIVAATHTHRAPRCMELELGPEHAAYRRKVAAVIAAVAGEAFRKLEPATIGWGTLDLPGHCRNRRWLMKPGTIGPDPFGNTTDRAKMYGGPGPNGLRTVGPIDPQLLVLDLKRPDGSPLATLANYSIHYGAGGPGISADYFGRVCRQLEADSPRLYLALMSNGHSGDIAPGGDPEPLANSVAGAIQKVRESISHEPWLPIRRKESPLSVAVRKPSRERLEWAREVKAGTWDKPSHKWKEKYAESALWLSRFPEEVGVRLGALALGDLGIALNPCEVYAETGLAIRRSSPFSGGCTLAFSNGYQGYLPTPAQHELGGYTTWPAVSSRLVKNAEPAIRTHALRLLHEVYPS